MKWWDIVEFGDEMLCSEVMKIGGVNDVYSDMKWFWKLGRKYNEKL